MQLSANHVATTILLLSQNGLRSNLRASIFLKNPGYGPVDKEDQQKLKSGLWPCLN